MDSGLPAHDLKKQKLSEDSDICKGEDRISTLHDAVLCHILSFLSTKDAVRTSVLAKRWNGLWVYVPNLDFELHLYKNYKGNKDNFSSFREGYMTSFTSFLDNLLVVRYNLSIHRFRFSCYGEVDMSRVHSWVCAAITCNLRELDLELTMSYPGGLTSSLFSCKTLEVLKIKGEFVLTLPYKVWLPNAKTVHLDSLVYLGDESIQKLLLGCPKLEDLMIRRINWDNLWSLEISVPSLKRLTLELSIHHETLHWAENNESDDDYYDEDLSREQNNAFKLTVNAPKLEYLKFEDHMSDSIMVTDMPLVVEAHVSVHKTFGECDWREEGEYADYAYELLRSISNVRRLQLSGYALQSLSWNFRAKLPTFRNLVFLEFGYDPREGPIMLPRLLESSPNLEILVFPQGFTVPEDREYDIEKDQFYEYNWSPPEPVPECLLLSLKIIEIRHFCGHEEEELKLVKYLLRNAMVLEKLTIFCHYTFFGDNTFSYKEELENYPRGSTDCLLKIYIPRLVNIEDVSSSA